LQNGTIEAKNDNSRETGRERTASEHTSRISKSERA